MDHKSRRIRSKPVVVCCCCSSSTRTSSTSRSSLCVLVIAVFLLGRAGVHAQSYSSGGDVAMDCSSCLCDGSSDAGTIKVFDNPSSGERIAYVDGDYLGILTTDCDTSVIAVGSVLYELSGIDLSDKLFGEVELSEDTCTFTGVPADTEYWRGTTTGMELSDGQTIRFTTCLARYLEDSTEIYKANTNALIQSVSENPTVSVNSICVESEFRSQLVTVESEGDTYLYNIDLVIDGESSSENLDVLDAPLASDAAFMCGSTDSTSELLVTPMPTPAPPPPSSPAPTEAEPETAEPTESPIAPTMSPVQTPAPQSVSSTDAPEASSTDAPESSATTAPVPIATEAPVEDGGPTTPAPVGSSSIPAETPVGTTFGPVPSTTPAPASVATDGPSSAVNATPAPTPTGVKSTMAPGSAGTGTMAPSSSSAGNTTTTTTIMDFEDNTTTYFGGEGIALAALGVLGMLTFSPLHAT